MAFLYDLLFPREPHVAICDRVTRTYLESFVEVAHIGLPFTCIAPLPYRKEVVKNMIQASKYHSHTHASKVLGEVLANFLSEELAEKQMFSTFTEPTVTYIPLHKKRFQERGYNQAERIAESVFETLEIQQGVLKETLLRNINTPSQSQTKNKEERFKNMKNAFVVKDNNDIKDKDIILIDDVVTTGATFASARDTLLKAGARDILCVAVAH